VLDPSPSDEVLEALLRASGDPAKPLELKRWLELAEAWYIARTLHALRGNRSAAARALSIGRRTLYAKMHKLGIEERWRVGKLEPGA
jgi:DNA-binding NtrC family response regulator